MSAKKDREYYLARTVIELLDEPEVRWRPLMFFGEKEFRRLATFLKGYDAALLDSSPDRSLFDGFREWMQMRHDANPSLCWSDHIHASRGDGLEAIEMFYRLWDDFRDERKSRGLRAILQEHAEYEMTRYGFRATSRERPYLN